DHGPEADLRVRLVQLLHAAELVDVLRLLLDQRVDDVVHGDDAEQVAAFVDDRHRQQIVLGDEPGRLLAIRPGADGDGRVPVADLQQRARRIREHQLAQGYRVHETAIHRIEDVHRVDGAARVTAAANL